RLAEALLPDPGRLCGELPRARRRDEVGELRAEERQPRVRELHDALRLRGERRGGRVLDAQRNARDGARFVPRPEGGSADGGRAGGPPRSADRARARARLVGRGGPEALRAAVDYRGAARLTADDGSEVEGYVIDAREHEVRVWEKKGSGTTRIPSERIRRVALSGRDPAHTVAAG